MPSVEFSVQAIRLAALVLLAIFWICAILAGFLFSIASPFWVMAAAASLASLVASYFLGSD